MGRAVAQAAAEQHQVAQIVVVSTTSDVQTSSPILLYSWHTQFKQPILTNRKWSLRLGGQVGGRGIWIRRTKYRTDKRTMAASWHTGPTVSNNNECGKMNS